MGSFRISLHFLPIVSIAIAFHLFNKSAMCFNIGSCISLDGEGTFDALAAALLSFAANFNARVSRIDLVATILGSILLIGGAIVACFCLRQGRKKLMEPRGHRSSIRECIILVQNVCRITRFLEFLSYVTIFFSRGSIPYLEMSTCPLILHLFLKQVQFKLYMSVQSGGTVRYMLILALETVGVV
jgi:hypothetical protein